MAQASGSSFQSHRYSLNITRTSSLACGSIVPIPVASSDQLIGRQLGNYRIDALIGAGGMGVVYRASDARLGRDVAVKVLPAEFAADPGRLQRFEHEARAVAALSHPNILAL